MKASVGAFPKATEVRAWLALAMGQFNLEITGGPTISIPEEPGNPGDRPPACVRYVIIDGQLRVIYNSHLSVLADDGSGGGLTEQSAVPVDYQTGAIVIRASFHIMLTYTSPERAAVLEPLPGTPQTDGQSGGGD